MVGEGQVEVLAPDPRQVGDVARPDARCRRPRPTSSPTCSRTTTSSVKSSEAASRVSVSSMPRSSAMCGPFTRLTGSSVWPERIPTRVGDAEDPRVLVGQAAAELHLDPVGRALAERLREPPELLAERHERAPAAPSPPGGPAAMLTAVVTTPPVSAAVTCSAVTTPARSCASAVEAPRWGVTTTSSRSRIGWPLNGSSGKTSRAAPGDLARLEALHQGVEVDQLAARAVHDPNAVAHLRDRGAHR